MTQTFIDTVLVSGLTGLALLVTGAHRALAGAGAGDPTGVPLLGTALDPALPTAFGGPILAVGLAIFALTTILAWAHYGERSAEYLFGGRATKPFRVLVVAAVLAGGLTLQLGVPGMDVVWYLGGVVTGAMVVPNLVGVLLLSGVVVRETERARPEAERQNP